MRLAGKVAIIIGATSGIGKASATLFSREGARVVCVGRRRKEGEQIVATIREAGGDAIFSRANVARSSEIRAMVQEAIQAYSKVDVLFNNAGTFPDVANRFVADISEDAWDQVLEVNLKGVFLTSKYVIPEMIRGGGGSIINTSSMLSLISRPHRAAYGASKGGVNALTRAMAIDLASAHIRVNCICPGLIETEMVRGQLQKVREDLMEWNRLMAEIPLGRTGIPEDVAHTALFLASDESAWITGTSISVDGGYTAR